MTRVYTTLILDSGRKVAVLAFVWPWREVKDWQTLQSVPLTRQEAQEVDDLLPAALGL